MSSYPISDDGSSVTPTGIPLPSDGIRKKKMEENRNSEMLIQRIDNKCRSVTWNALIVYVVLVLLSYAIGIKEGRIEKLTGVESHAPMMASVLLAISSFSTVSPLIFRATYRDTSGGASDTTDTGRHNTAMSGIMYTALVVQMVAFTTDLMLATLPVPVFIDPVTKQRIFLLRWCEWAPLSFVMTFLCEISKVEQDDDNDKDDDKKKKEVDEKSSIALLEQPQQGDNADVTLGSIRSAYMLAWSQALSTFCGWMFSQCPGFKSWIVCIIISFVLFFFIYHRLYVRKASFRKSNSKMIAWISATKKISKNNYYTADTAIEGQSEATCSTPSIGEQEMYNCRCQSLALLFTCTALWTSLVVAYLMYSIGPLLFPNNAFLKMKGLNMICECFIDVLFKSIYMVLIIDVYDTIFDPSARAQRRLNELRSMMGVVWNNSSDVIGISVRSSSGRVRTVVSPTFFKAFSNNADNNERYPALAFEVDSSSFVQLPLNNNKKNSNKNNDGKNSNNNKESYVSIHPSAIYGIEFTDVGGRNSSSNGGKDGKKTHDTQINLDSDALREEITSMAELVGRAWTSKNEPELLLMHDLTKRDGYAKQQIRCEANVTRMEENSLIIVVRDISERFRRFEAEKKMVSETTARLKDEAANRFTKHEVKNGLLAAIGLCDSLREATAAAAAATTAANNITNNIGLLREEKRASFTTSSFASRAIALREESRASFMFELDKTLHEILDTVMAEAMARDVIHEVYEPKLERVDVVKLLNSTMNTAASEVSFKRFPLSCDPELLPDYALDPQLLKFIHRNAISNACKYGERGGNVVTEVKWHREKKSMEMKVINLPGKKHGEILELGSDKASELIFSPGIRLDVHKSGANGKSNNETISSHSAGDGAWIMSKCAKTLKGRCDLKFFSDKTVFTFRCPVSLYNATNSKAGLYNSKSLSEFELPENIYGIAIDDSKIQRKLLLRYFGFAGISKDRIRVYGQNASEIRGFADCVVKFVDERPDDYFLLVVDENLEITEDEDTDGTSRFNHLTRDCTVLGSQLVSNIRKRLLPDQERRVLALIRSANDSANDIAIYNSRAHGYLPKAPIKGLVGVKEQLAPFWLSRYNDSKSSNKKISNGNKDVGGDEDEIAAFVNDLIANILSIDRLISIIIVPSSAADDDADADPKELLAKQWPSIWDKLHGLKGDLQTVNDDDEGTGEMSRVINTINKMRGPNIPVGFVEMWEELNSVLRSCLASIGKQDNKQRN